jgi:ribosomal protein S18 acetylase RimI-like enzyme
MKPFDESKLIIRPVRIDDISGIIHVTQTAWLTTYPNEALGITGRDIQTAINALSHEDELARFSSDFIQKADERKYFVAEYDGTIVGYCRIKIKPDFYELRAIYLLPEFQQKGIGKRLYKKATEELDPEKNIILFVAPYNIQAVTFYERLGFKKEAKEIEGFKLPNGKSILEIQMTKSHE